MARERNRRPERKMKPVYIVFCEGETEENYVTFLRVSYRVPLKVISKITGQKISQALIARHERAERITKYDDITSFTMYDLDTPNILDRLKKCSAISISSNPCIELWFLLHVCDQQAAIASDVCVKKLKNISPEWFSYEKGHLTVRQQYSLRDTVSTACGRAQQLSDPNNPSTTVYRLIDKLQEAGK